mmetsp:Transcript_110471/g.236042  ORF Transcript_110471/g.236042 Transcript_110471/m.236042 type:complete len:561 (-) Transcript_110471:43-1725(-)
MLGPDSRPRHSREAARVDLLSLEERESGLPPRAPDFTHSSYHDFGSSSSSSSSVHEPCDPCEGRCPFLLYTCVLILALVKVALVAPLALCILYGGCTIGIALALFGAFLAMPAFLVANMFMSHDGSCTCQSFLRFCVTAVAGVVHPVLVSSIALLCLLFGAPLFALVKPVLDTFSAWRMGKVWYLPHVFMPPTAEAGRVTRSTRLRTRAAASPFLTEARGDAFNGTLSVLAEVCVLVPCTFFVVSMCHWTFMSQLIRILNGHQIRKVKIKTHRCRHCGIVSASCIKDDSGTYFCKSCSHPEDLALHTFIAELTEVGTAAINAGLITTTECEDSEPFLILGLPGLVLLRCVARTCGDEDDVDEDTIDNLLLFLSKAYRDQGEGMMEVWGVDGNIYAFDESQGMATDAWLDAKEAIEEAGFLDSDSDNNDGSQHEKSRADRTWWRSLVGRAGDSDGERVSEYAIFEAWVLYGERRETPQVQAQAKRFLNAYEELPPDRQTAINRTAAKIRSVALMISKTPSVQARLMKVLEELGAQGKEKGARTCCAQLRALYDCSALFDGM